MFVVVVVVVVVVVFYVLFAQYFTIGMTTLEVFRQLFHEGLIETIQFILKLLYTVSQEVVSPFEFLLLQL